MPASLLAAVLRCAVATAVLALAAGCFNPDDIFPVHGQVVSANGVEGLTVELLRAQQAGFTGTCDEAKAFKTTTTDAEGNFNFDVFRAQTTSLSMQGSFCFRVRVVFPSGTVDTSDLSGIFNETSLGKFRDWEPNARLENGELKFTPVYPLEELDDAGSTLAHAADFETADGGLAWVLDDLFVDTTTAGEELIRKPMLFDQRHIEDFTGELVLSAVTSDRSGQDLGPLGRFVSVSTVTITPTQRVPVMGATVPMSRDAGCPMFTRPCTLTDGELTPASLGFRQSVSVELDAPQLVSSIVLRELESGAPLVIAVLSDADGGTVRTQQHVFDFSQRSLSTIPRRSRRDGGISSFGSIPAWTVIELDGGVMAKKVTLNFTSGVQSLSEVSLY